MREQDGRGVGGCEVYLSPQIHREYTFGHRSACKTPAESRQECLTSYKELYEAWLVPGEKLAYEEVLLQPMSKISSQELLLKKQYCCSIQFFQESKEAVKLARDRRGSKQFMPRKENSRNIIQVPYPHRPDQLGKQNKYTQKPC